MDAERLNARPCGRTALTGRAHINWSPTDADLFQLTVVAYGRSLLAQGDVDPRYGINFGYRRKLSEGLFLTLTGEDVTGGISRYRVAVNSPSVTLLATTRYNGPAGIIGLSYTFGGAPAARKRAAPTLEYGGAAPPP